MQAQQQQAQMQAQQMKIAEAQRVEAMRVKAQQEAQTYYGNQVGPMTALRTAQMNTNPAALLQSDIAAKTASDAASLAHVRDLETKNLSMLNKQQLGAKDVIDIERNISKNVQSEMGPQIDRVRGYGQMEAIFSDPLKAGNAIEGTQIKVKGVGEDGKTFALSGQGAADMALIFSFMKMNDPGSVVRESEFQMAADTAGMAQGLKNTMSKVMSGDKLSANERKLLMKQARNQYGAAQKELDLRIEQEKKKFNLYDYAGLDANRAFGSIYTPYTPQFASSVFDVTSPKSTPSTVGVVKQGEVPAGIFGKDSGNLSDSEGSF
tara:strand:+ start:1 stop:960 length:960 start_codon:yes stop_codon:yes gene_type:complete